ncbi:outer membrane receptor protein involved in Fe transport [Sphingomonas jinjuensis]|uniref:Outer membrane receptor protein involved in Fe transport n=1 Tax=Sphingomonas jinjuensis TaxID=535907 RepID=A0A840FDZ6_9SPHN|nr:TonB-dependent receptor [Sphingomonas jinjuensis]MBB4153964.1 outer membrane receptor protein involved in Fe transport [Sphingomonas jinjuensis]
MKAGSLRVALLAGVATAFLAIGSASAQTGPATTPVPQTDDPQAAIDPAQATGGDIIVTATKSNERLLDVPASVSVISATDLSKQGVVRFADYAAQVPGLSLTSARTGITQITLRGITTGAAQPGSTTGYYVDEAPVGSVNAYTGGNAITPDLDPSDLAQIEVLKGPQGTLYGAGAVGGLLKFTTAAPNFNEVEARGQLGVTSVAKGDIGYSARGMVNVPLAPGQLVFHASGFYRLDPGYVDNINPRIGRADVNLARVRGGRAVLAMKFGPDIRLDLSAIGQDITTQGTNTVDVDAVTQRPVYGDLKQNRFAAEQGYVRFRLYNATIRGDAGPVELVSSTTYQRISYRELTDGTRGYGAALGPRLGLGSTLGVRLNTLKHTDRWSEEARASSNGLFGGLLDLQAGFYWTLENSQNRIPNIDTFSTVTGAAIPLPALAIAKIDSRYEEYSVFGNARIHFGDKFDILGGVRQAHDNQNYLQDYQGLLVGPRLIVPGKESADVTTWMVSPRFRPSDNLTVYARAATGYRPGGPNPAPPTSTTVPLVFQPDRLTQYEVGLKAQGMDRKVSLETALFYTDWNDIQIQTSGGGFNYLVNGGSARSQGAEATLRIQPATGLNLTGNVGYTDAKLTSAAPAAGGLDGDRLPYVPRWAGSVNADYSAPLGGDTALTLGASANYTGDRISDYANRFPKRLGAFTTFDLRAGVQTGAISLSVFARNITDKRAYLITQQQGLAPSNTSGAFYAAAVNQPRLIGAEAAFRF